LEGIRVLDLTNSQAGGIGTMVLGDFGAEVIKVEPPGGVSSRAIPASLLWDRGKRSVTLDLQTPQGQEQLRRLSSSADVFVEDFRPGALDRLGLGYDALQRLNGRLVYCSVTGYGPKGPYAQYKAYPAAVMAKSGRLVNFEGQKERSGPFYGAVDVASHGAGMAVARGTVAALYVRDRTGRGQHVETSLLQAVTAYDLNNWFVWQQMIKDPVNFSGDPASDLKRRPTPAYLPVRTKDGRWMQMANLMPHLFRNSLKSIGLGDLLEDPRFATAPTMTPENAQALRVLMLQRMQERTLDDWMSFFIKEAKDVAAEPFMTAQEGMNHPQVLHNGNVVEVDDPRVGRMRQLGMLAKFHETPGSVKGPAPLPGQDTAAVLARLPDASPSHNGQGLKAQPPRHPLDGALVIDMATVIAGPLGCSLLTQLGARVIHIEAPQGDIMRGALRSAGALYAQAGSESLGLDLKTPEGSRILQQLLARADLVVHNMRRGAPERLGIGYEQLHKVYPRLVYLYVGGYGSTGPSSHRPAMHPIPGAVMGGALSQMGRGGMPPADQPMSLDEIQEVSRQFGRANEANPDPNTSMVVATAGTFGLYARERTGEGQYIEVNMINANAYANANDCFSYAGKPPRELHDPEGYGLHALYRLYRAKVGWVFLACPLEEEWRALCTALSRQDLLQDSRFATPVARKEHDDALAEQLAQVFSTRPATEWEGMLTARDVCCVQAEDRGFFHFFAYDPHVAENGFTTVVKNPRFGEYWRYSPLVNYSLTPGKAGPGPLRGQHTRDILRDLGYSDAQVDDLKARKVVDWETP
jgi:crotonobetainyl-CoA:carnitine CoA-transferase CaiB-like acyl-CoA transferase